MERPIRIAYPDLFPYFRFEVFAPTDLGLHKHQNPYGGNLCLMDQSTASWEVDDIAADVLAAQVPRLEKSNSAHEPRPDLEVPQAEPVTFYFEHASQSDSVILVPAEAHRLATQRKRGILTIDLATERNRIRGFVTAIDGVATTLPDLKASLRTTRAVTCDWHRLDAPPPLTFAPQLLPWLIGEHAIPEPRLQQGEIELSAVTFPEETSYGAPTEDGWLFVAARGTGAGGYQMQLVRADRFDPSVQSARVPSLADLPNKRVALVGCGGLGAPLAHLLMQMRVGELRLVDHDLVTAGNIVRWPLGLEAVGLSKAEALAEFGRNNYPETKYRVLSWHIGMSTLNEMSPDEANLTTDVLEGADLVLDATAELGVQLYLSDQARGAGVPYITVEGREGGYGGIVARYVPGRGSCYNCFKLHQRDGHFTVIGDEHGTVQPRGCATPTFTGAAFDLVPLAAQAARMAAQTMSRSPELTDTVHDISVFVATQPNDKAAGPRWEHAPLVPHPECPRCSG